MLQLSPDASFHYELLRVTALSVYDGSDIAEVLEAAGSIEPGNFESFSSVFNALAERVLTRAEAIDTIKYPVSARDAYFAAATYFRNADFYLHGKKDDPRINELWVKQTYAFDKANALLRIPGKRVLLKAEGFDVPAIFYSAGGEGKKPTLILGNGYDGAQEEMLHNCGFAALERGLNVILYEGPGQPTVVRSQGLGFIAEWEKVVTPVVDYLETLAEVDMEKVGLMGFSMGGFFCVRAAAFEHRLAAVLAIDGVYDVADGLTNVFGSNLKNTIKAGDFEAAESLFQAMLANPHLSTPARWAIEHGMWSFNTDSIVDFTNRTMLMTLKGLEDKVQCPMLVGLAENDIFFKGEPEKVMKAFGKKATLMKLLAKDAAGEHCHLGALKMMSGIVMNWFQDVISKN